MLAIDCGYRPRAQFEPFHKRTERFSCIVAHRRAGKTVACINDLQDGALRSQKLRPRFAYISPYLKQSKAVAWDYLKAAIDPLRRLGAVENESELRVDYHNGGQVRLYGADNMDALRGIYLDGVVLDEFADMDPRVWSEIIRPALADRKGWAVFIGTPKGRNDFFKIYERSKTEPNWFSLMLKSSETELIEPSELELARRDLTEDQYAQEFECSFDAAIVGAYYGKQMRQAEEAMPPRITGIPYDRESRVYTAWDLGFRDATAVWFVQMVGREVHVIDYYEMSGTDIAEDVKVILDKPYSYAGHIIPHDGFNVSKQTGKTTAQLMENLGLRDLMRAPDHRVEDGINQVTLFLSRCFFDAAKCARGIDCLKLYRTAYDDKLKTLKPRPVHDWASHGADAFRYLAMTLDSAQPVAPLKLAIGGRGSWMGG